VPDKAMFLTAAEVAIVTKLRDASLVESITCYDDHAWKMLITVARQLAKRPMQHQHKQQHRETTNARR
jgi:hypothetical protein